MYWKSNPPSGAHLDRKIVHLSTGKPTVDQVGIALHPPPGAGGWPAKGAGLSPGQVVLFSQDSVLLPYLPDPLAVGVAVTGYDHTGAEKFHEVAAFDGTWPELKPFRLRLSEIPWAEPPPPPSAKFEDGVLQVRLSKADVVHVRLSSIFPADDLDLFAVWNLIQAPPSDLDTRALEGRHWMLTPFRRLTFTHAVQQPLQDPTFQAVQPEPRPLGATSATFRGPIGCHAKSTGRLDVMAAWTEDVDLVTDDDGPRWKAGGNPVENTARAFGFDIDPDEDAAQVTLTRRLQDDWRWCRLCEGLFFGGGSTKGKCPSEAGAVHADDASGNYVLAHNDDDAPDQAGWRWCKKCQGLFFAGAGSNCPAEGEHDATGSGAYTLVHQQPNAPGQNGWRYCSKCRGLAWGVDQPGACPSGGVHEHSTSGIYTLRTVVTTPQDRISRHEFGDTKYRQVQYHTVATTRFREYLPPELYRDDESVLQRDEPALQTRDVLSSARPAAPDVAYVVPTFGWETSEEAGATVHVRRGKGVRVYLRRPWFSSGDGELLGVVLRRPGRIFRPGPPTVDIHPPIVPTRAGEEPAGPVRDLDPGGTSIEPVPLAPSENPAFVPAKPPVIEEEIVLPPGVISAMQKDPLDGFVTAWGSDPVWRSAHPPESPSASRFPSHVDFDDDLTLEELDPTYRVDVAAHALQYHPKRRLWYSDIEVDMGDAYFPFVRMALARYQRMSVADAHLSRVVMTDFVQLAPDRRTTVTLGGDVAKVQVQGVFGMNRIADSPPSVETPEPTTDMWARLEVHDDAMGGDLAWKPASDPVELKPVAKRGFRVIWSGSVEVPPGALGAGTHRLMITETERYRRDPEPGDPMYAHNVYTRSRIVFADEFVL